MPFERGSERGFLGVSAMLFVASAALTVVWCSSMSAMGRVSMPGGWTVSMMWIRMPGRSWFSVAASFLGMWIVMMVTMMLPSLVPMLRRFRCTVGRMRTMDLGLLTALAALGYFFVWTAFGAVVFPIGAALSAIAMREPEVARAAPVWAGSIVSIAVALHLRTSRPRRISVCWSGAMSNRILPSELAAAWRHGVRLGIDCARRCSGLMIVVLIVGMTDLGVMAVATAAITADSLLRRRHRACQRDALIRIVEYQA